MVTRQDGFRVRNRIFEIPTHSVKPRKFDEEHVQELVELLERGKRLPPIVVRWQYPGWWLIDGNHRLEAHLRLGRRTIFAREEL